MMLRLLGPGSAASLSNNRRLAVSILLVACVHVSLFFFGNENATPPMILGSFVLSTTMLVISQRVRAKLTAPRPAPPASMP